MRAHKSGHPFLDPPVIACYTDGSLSDLENDMLNEAGKNHNTQLPYQEAL